MEQQPTEPKKRRRPLVIAGIAAGALVGMCLCLAVFSALVPNTDDNRSSTPIAERVETTPTIGNERGVAVATLPKATIAVAPSEPVTVGFNEEVQTDKWALTVTEVQRTNTLEWQGRRLEPVGQWLIVWAEVRNLTTEPTSLSGSDFKLTTPELKGEIKQNGSATRAATALRYDPSDTVADFFGMTVEAGSSRPMAVAFDVPPAAQTLELHVKGDAGTVALGRVDAIAAMPTPTATPTPIPTNTSVPTATPVPTNTARPAAPTEASSPIPAQAATGSTANTAANLRAGPGTNFDQVGRVAAGQSLDLVASNQAGDWYKLASGAWIAAFLVDNAPGGLPVEEASPPQAQPPTATPDPGSVARPIRIGTHIVGDSIQPGIYRGVAGQGALNSCYWERLGDLSGELGSIIANDNAVGQFYVEVKATDYALETACQLTPLAQAPVPSVGDTLAPGTYLVGRDIGPGTYRGEAGTGVLDSCYWERLNDVAGELGSIIANDNAMGSYFVQVLGSDFALKTGCSLVRVGD